MISRELIDVTKRITSLGVEGYLQAKQDEASLEMLRNDIIEECCSSWSSSVVLVAKNTGLPGSVLITEN